VVEQRPFKPFQQLRQKMPQVVKTRNFNQMYEISFATRGPHLPQIASPTATKTATKKNTTELI